MAKRKTVLVTGGAGLIGAKVCQELLARDCQPVIYDALLEYFPPSAAVGSLSPAQRVQSLRPMVPVIHGNTRDASLVRQAVEELRPDLTIHLASLSIASLCQDRPEEALGNNVQGTTNLLDALRENGVMGRFVYVSSSMVYGDFTSSVATETDPLEPQEVYGGSKLAAEILVRAYGREFGIPHTIIRPTTVYGPGDANRRVVQTFLENALLGRPLDVRGGEDNSLDFTYVDDAARGIVQAALSPAGENETFNLARGESRPLLELALLIKRDFPEVVINVRPRDISRPKRGTLDIRKARERLGYSPTHRLEDGLRKCIDYVRKRSPHAAPLSAVKPAQPASLGDWT